MSELTKDAYLKALSAEVDHLQAQAENVRRILDKSPGIGEEAKKHLWSSLEAVEGNIKGLRAKIIEIS